MEAKDYYRDKDWMKRQYLELDKSINEIANDLGVGNAVVGYWKRKFNLKKLHKYKLNISTFEKFKMKMGCQKCGYNKNGHVLQFHHKRGYYIINPRTYLSENAKKAIENKDIILLCANCHRELHYKRGERKLD